MRRNFELLLYGIEGKHWGPAGDKMWSAGPDNDQYTGGTWGFANQNLRRMKDGAYPVPSFLSFLMYIKKKHWP
ncbi:hypothetical protein AB6A23_26155 [Paenibacillus tarimensis]